jgi:hypothetical protein
VQILEPYELAFARKIARSVGIGLETEEKIAQAGFQMRLEHRPVTAQRFALSGIETSKAQAIAKAASLRPACLI